MAERKEDRARGAVPRLEEGQHGGGALARRDAVDPLEDHGGRLVGELNSRLGEAEGEIALLGEGVHGHRLPVESQHALLLGAALDEGEHLLEEAVAAESRVDHALSEIADGSAGSSHFPGEAADDLAVGRRPDAYLEQAAPEHLAHTVGKIEVLVRHAVAVHGIRAARDPDRIVGRHGAHRHARRGRLRRRSRGACGQTFAQTSLDVVEGQVLDDLHAIALGAEIHEAHRIGAGGEGRGRHGRAGLDPAPVERSALILHGEDELAGPSHEHEVEARGLTQLEAVLDDVEADFLGRPREGGDIGCAQAKRGRSFAEEGEGSGEVVTLGRQHEAGDQALRRGFIALAAHPGDPTQGARHGQDGGAV